MARTHRDEFAFDEPPTPGPARSRVPSLSDRQKRLPTDVRECYLDLLRTYDSKRSPLWGFSAAYGHAVCDALGSGQSREEVLQSSEGFFSESEHVAIVDTAIEVICPQYPTKKNAGLPSSEEPAADDGNSVSG